MRLTLDENLGRRGTTILATAGLDVATVAEERLCAATEREVAVACRAEATGGISEGRSAVEPKITKL